MSGFRVHRVGTTSSALHFLVPDPGTDPRTLVADAYVTIGWREVRSGTRQAVLVKAETQPFVSLFDSDCSEIDDGTLRELAVKLSDGPEGFAIVTSILDGDSYSVVCFAQGKQVDAIASEGAADPSYAVLPKDTRMAVLSEHLGRVVTGQPEFIDDSSAEAALATWSIALGLTPDRVLARIPDLMASDIIARIALHSVKRPSVPGSSGPVLQAYHDDDDCPHHRVFPAAWPVPTTRPFGAKWIVLSSEGGFDGLDFELGVSETTGKIHLNHIEIAAFPFYNGQIVSASAIASDTIIIGEDVADGRYARSVDHFTVPAMDPSAKKRIALLIRPEFRMETGASVRLDLHLTPHVEGALRFACPAARLKGTALSWRPMDADPNTTDVMRERALLLLNEPSVLSCLAIGPDRGDAVRSHTQQLFSSFLSLLAPSKPPMVELHTEKHMTRSGSVAKNDVVVPMTSLADHKLWRRAFAAKSDLQSVFLGIVPEGAYLPMAGAVLQMPLREDPEQTDDPISPHIALWAVDAPEAWQALGTTAAGIEDLFRTWIADNEVLQVGIQRTAWIPEFDRYDGYAETPLEDLSAVDWFRDGLRGHLMQAEWCRKKLRFLAPEMWLSADLVAQITDGPALEKAAQMDKFGNTVHFALRPNARLTDLETALRSLLP